MKRSILLLLPALLTFSSLSGLFISTTQVSALSGSDWRAGNITDDGIFTNKDAMSVAEIQGFLNSKVGTGGYASVPGQCDVNGTRSAAPYSNMTRAEYARSLGRTDKFTCLNIYYEVPKTSPGPDVPASNYGGAPIPAGAQSAAQLIWNAAQRYNISPKVLLVTIEKESAGPLTRDDWPFQKQYTYAMGAHCPDSGPGGSANCDPNWSGFSLQIDESAALFRWYLDNMSQPWWSYKKPGYNSILYNPNTGCGSSNVLIENKATAALYTYTPYQPNQAALNNLYGTGDGCSAYGNRNYWRIYSDWFGSTYTTGKLLQNSLGTNQLTPGAIMNAGDYIVSPNGRFVTTMQYDGNLVTYLGSKVVWSSGTYGGYGNYAKFQSDGNLVVYRVDGSYGGWNSTTWNSGSDAVTLGTDGNLVIAAGATRKWATDIRVNQYATNNLGSQAASPTRLNPGDFLKSPSGLYSLVMQSDGNLVLYTADGTAIWNTHTWNNPGAYMVMQNDGNLVVYNQSNAALWHSHTWNKGASTLKLQDDGNLALYTNSDNTITWRSDTSTNNNFTTTNYRGANMSSASTLNPGDFLRSSDYRYILAMQYDGNLVMYSVNNYTPVWHTHTWNNPGAYMVMQNDGNLVVYSNSNAALWHTYTYTQGPSILKLQNDGNLVVYRNSDGWFTWYSGTAGKF